MPYIFVPNIYFWDVVKKKFHAKSKMIDWALRWANCKVAHSRFRQVMHMRVAYFQTHELVLKRAKVLSHIIWLLEELWLADAVERSN